MTLNRIKTAVMKQRIVKGNAVNIFFKVYKI